jgi:O-antigen ligase
MITKGLQLWTESPVFGYGQGQFGVASGMVGYAHNNYIEVLVNLGAIGFLLYYGLFVVIAIRAFRNIRRGQQNQWAVIFMLMLLLALDFVIISYYIEKIVWAILGLAAAFSESSSTVQPPNVRIRQRVRIAQN